MTHLDCLPCFLRHSLDAARMVSADPALHEELIRETARWISTMDLALPQPIIAARLHRRIRELTGKEDPYREARDRQNQVAQRLLPGLESLVKESPDPLYSSVSVAIAGNVIDMGMKSEVTEADVRQAIKQAMEKPFAGDMSAFRDECSRARKILYLADNAGEIILDRLLIEQIGPEKITLAVRGAPVINDAILRDAETAGLLDIVEVIDNGSDAPGTVLADCSPGFNRRFAEADMIVSKGQGNFESLHGDDCRIFFLFKVKCHVNAARARQPLGTHVLARNGHP